MPFWQWHRSACLEGDSVKPVKKLGERCNFVLCNFNFVHFTACSWTWHKKEKKSCFTHFPLIFWSYFLMLFVCYLYFWKNNESKETKNAVKRCREAIDWNDELVMRGLHSTGRLSTLGLPLASTTTPFYLSSRTLFIYRYIQSLSYISIYKPAPHRSATLSSPRHGARFLRWMRRR